MHNLINGISKKDLIIKIKDFSSENSDSLITEIQSICDGDFLNKNRKDI